jgi:hypothetical protein
MLKGFYLTLLMGPFIAVPVPQPVTDALSSVQVTVSAGQRSGFQLTFAVSKKSLLNRALLPAGFFDPKIRVIIVMTLNGIPTVLMDGIITRQEITPSSEPAQSVLTVTGEDLSVLMDLEDKTGDAYPAMPAGVRVLKILASYAAYGIVPLVVTELFPFLPIPVKATPAQKGTDLAYIKKLAEENGFVFYIDPGPAPGANVAYWGPEIRIGVPQSALNINMDAHTNVESLSFSFDGLSSTELVVNFQEPTTGLTISIPVPNVSLLRPPLALKPAPKLKKEPLRDISKLDVTQILAMGLSKTASSGDAITGTGQLDVLRYGQILHARRLVGVRGVGMAYDGLYFVKSATHNIKRGEYKQSFSLARDGLIPLTPRVIP